MTPTEKHRETACQCLEGMSVAYKGTGGLRVAEDRISTALASAEREGMKRAAEIARDLPACELTSVSPSGGITPKMAFGVGADAQRSAIERAILSEAGESE